MSDRIAVIGAGVIGLSTAVALGRLGHSVTVVDKSEPGGGTSGTSFAWLNANDKHPRSYQTLNVAGVEWYRRLASDGVERDWLNLRGRIEWASSPAGIESLETRVGVMESWDYPVERITAAEALRLEPDLVIEPRSEIRLWPSEGFVIPERWIAELTMQAAAAGVGIRTGAAVTGISTASDGCVLTLEDGSILEAGTVVSCAGRWTEGVIALAGGRVPMIPDEHGGRTLGLLGYSNVTATRLTRTVSSEDVNIRPDGPAGRYVLQSTDLDPSVRPDIVPPNDGPEARVILERARRVLRGFGEAGVHELRVGRRAIPADRVTVCGWLPGSDRVYVITTHSGYTLGPLIGELAADEIAGGTNHPILEDFRPSRFALGAPAAATVARES